MLYSWQGPNPLSCKKKKTNKGEKKNTEQVYHISLSSTFVGGTVLGECIIFSRFTEIGIHSTGVIFYM